MKWTPYSSFKCLQSVTVEYKLSCAMEICKLAVAYGGDIYVTDIYVVQLHAIYVKVLTFT
jgi:hypothetical protein